MDREKKRVQRLCRDFVRMEKGSILDAPAASYKMFDLWGIKVDWHEFSEAMDAMTRTGEAAEVGQTRDGRITYLIA